MPIVCGCSKLRLAAFHLGHTHYGGSKVPCRFLSLDTLWRSHFRPYRGTSWPGWLGHFLFRRLGVRGQEPRHRVTVWHRIRWWIQMLHTLRLGFNALSGLYWRSDYPHFVGFWMWCCHCGLCCGGFLPHICIIVYRSSPVWSMAHLVVFRGHHSMDLVILIPPVPQDQSRLSSAHRHQHVLGLRILLDGWIQHICYLLLK